MKRQPDPLGISKYFSCLRIKLWVLNECTKHRLNPLKYLRNMSRNLNDFINIHFNISYTQFNYTQFIINRFHKIYFRANFNGTLLWNKWSVRVCSVYWNLFRITNEFMLLMNRQISNLCATVSRCALTSWIENEYASKWFSI